MGKLVTKCPFCRDFPVDLSDAESLRLLRKRIDVHNDREAINGLGVYYLNGIMGLPVDEAKAFQLILKAAKMGSSDACNNLGNLYYMGQGCERSMKNSKHYYELAAIGGDVPARASLGQDEARAGNYQRSMRHWKISAAQGCDTSLQGLKTGYSTGHVTKDDFAQALRAHKEAKDGMKSKERDEARFYN